MKFIKAILETLGWFISPTCDHDAGICISGQGRSCKIIKNKKGIEIEEKNYRFKNN